MKNEKNKGAKGQKLRIMSLGGLAEVGKNMTVFEYGNDIVRSIIISKCTSLRDMILMSKMKRIIFRDDSGNMHGTSSFYVIKPCLYVVRSARYDCFAVFPAADTAKNSLRAGCHIRKCKASLMQINSQ